MYEYITEYTVYNVWKHPDEYYIHNMILGQLSFP